MGAVSRKVGSIAELETALQDTESVERTTVIVIDTDPLITTDAGGHWWDVAVPEVSDAAAGERGARGLCGGAEGAAGGIGARPASYG